MKKKVFITGVTGFVGRNLLKMMDFAQYQHIYGVGRSENDAIRPFLGGDNFTFIQSDILDAQGYREYLKSSDVVVHLAALTGKACEEEYFRVNLDGTRVLLEQCQAVKIDRFLYISSIAAKFSDVKYYHYAKAKLAAEDEVRNSTIPYTIIRPTILLGNGAPLLESFKKLIKGPVVPIFGDGLTRIQPIYVGDFADCILDIINHDRFKSETIEVGGPEEITIESFIKRFQGLMKNDVYRSVHLPIWLFRGILGRLERYFINIIPFTAGQLASFSNNGTAEENAYMNSERTSMIGIDEMLARSMKEKGTDLLHIKSQRKECEILGRYLVNSDVNAYTKEKYIQGHKKLCIGTANGFIDRLLMKRATKGLFWVGIADVYSSIICRNALIRKKILLMIAILECQQPSYQILDTVEKKHRYWLYLELVKRALVFSANLILSIILIGPFHAVSSFVKKGAEDR